MCNKINIYRQADKNQETLLWDELIKNQKILLHEEGGFYITVKQSRSEEIKTLYACSACEKCYNKALIQQKKVKP